MRCQQKTRPQKKPGFWSSRKNISSIRRVFPGNVRIPWQMSPVPGLLLRSAVEYPNILASGTWARTCSMALPGLKAVNNAVTGGNVAHYFAYKIFGAHNIYGHYRFKHAREKPCGKHCQSPWQQQLSNARGVAFNSSYMVLSSTTPTS